MIFVEWRSPELDWIFESFDGGWSSRERLVTNVGMVDNHPLHGLVDDHPCNGMLYAHPWDGG